MVFCISTILKDNSDKTRRMHSSRMCTACSLTASRSIRRGRGVVHALWGIRAQGRCVCLWGHACPEWCACLGGGLCAQGVCMRALGACPWTEFLTRACENITFPQLPLRAVIILKYIYSSYIHINHITLNVQFAREVLHLVESPGVPVAPEVSMRSSPRKPHKVWCEKTWHNVIPTLEHWLAQVRDMKVWPCSY